GPAGAVTISGVRVRVGAASVAGDGVRSPLRRGRLLCSLWYAHCVRFCTAFGLLYARCARFCRVSGSTFSTTATEGSEQKGTQCPYQSERSERAKANAVSVPRSVSLRWGKAQRFNRIGPQPSGAPRWRSLSGLTTT